MQKFAPVIIPTLCRYDKLKVLVESLARNGEYAKETELVIGLDFPSEDRYYKGNQIIKEYLPSISGFGKVTVIEHKENLGATNNENSLIDYVYSEGYDRFIYTEDDNEFSPNFLEFINKGLAKYESEPRVYAISGYNYPISMEGYDKNIYASIRCSAWGCGFWKNKRNDMSAKEFTKFILKPSHFIKLFKMPSKIMSLFIMLAKGELYGDNCYEILSIVNNWVTIFPTISKVRNWGHDGSGEHGEINPDEDPCYNQPIDTAHSFDYDEIPLVSLKWKPLEEYFNESLSFYLSRIFKYFNLSNKYKK